MKKKKKKFLLESLQTEKICDRPGRDISPLRLAELGHKKKVDGEHKPRSLGSFVSRPLYIKVL